jgi:hypothetical protein
MHHPVVVEDRRDFHLKYVCFTNSQGVPGKFSRVKIFFDLDLGQRILTLKEIHYYKRGNYNARTFRNSNHEGQSGHLGRY